MKRVLKVLIPLVLVLALLAAACWFFLIHRSSLTSDFLLRQAQSMAEKQRYDRAITYYTWSWQLNPQQNGIAVELADTYANSGNYTKAEYTLVQAISQSPQAADLYVALSRVYVEQDKLLDAVQMLDRITDDSVRAQLDALRPAAPVLSPENGYYTEYIEVSAAAETGDLYLTITGEYPSMASDAYIAPMTLPAGESAVLAVAVDENGLVSPAAHGGYTVGGVVEAVTLTDPATEETIRTMLGLSASDIIMSDDLWAITDLELPQTVTDLSDLKWFTGLLSLTIHNVPGLDLSVLGNLTSLQQLDLDGCTLSSSSLEAIAGLVRLQTLSLDGCALTDIGSLAQLVGLQSLTLSNNSISDISVLSLMLDLQHVELANNPVSSIAPLSPCNQLQSLDITGCDVGSVGSLTGKDQLTTLLAANNQISDLAPLAGCEGLSVLVVNHNLVLDIEVLTTLPSLTRFEANNNHITAVPDFDEQTSLLQQFHADYNQITDISGLANLQSLNYVYADYNQIASLIPLEQNYNLIQVNVWDNPVPAEDVAALQAHSIIVNYNPNYEPPVPEETEAESEE